MELLTLGAWLAGAFAVLLVLTLLYQLARFLVPGPRHQPAMDLRGKTVLITGASSGLGKAMAFEFHARGARVILASRNGKLLEQVCGELEAANNERRWRNPHRPAFLAMDLENLKDEGALKQKVAELLALSADGEHVDVLVNNAGLMNTGSCVATPMDVYRRLMEVNYFGHVALTRALYNRIPDDGAVLTIGSVTGRVGIPYLSAYSAAKHAIQAWMDALRCEDRPRLQILTVTAGYINTGMGTRALTAQGEQAGDEDPYQLRGYTVEYAAHAIVSALVDRETELLLAPFLPRLILSLRLFVPNLLWYSLHRRTQSKKTRK